MSPSHAVLWIDHDTAQVLPLEAGGGDPTKVKAHHHKRQHGSGVRTEHEFFGHVCDALAGLDEVLVVGHETARTDFRHYVDKHRAALARHLVGWEAADHPTVPQLVALGRKYFVRHDRMAAPPAP